MTAIEIIAAGNKIGRAIARDVIADGLDREWTGLTAEDGDQIPDHLTQDEDAVEAIEWVAKQAYEEAIANG